MNSHLPKVFQEFVSNYECHPRAEYIEKYSCSQLYLEILLAAYVAGWKMD